MTGRETLLRFIGALLLPAGCFLSQNAVAQFATGDTEELYLDVDKDGATDRVSIVRLDRAERARVVVSFANGRSISPLTLQLLPGDRISVALHAGEGDPYCGEMPNEADWPKEPVCGRFATHSPVPFFSVRHSRLGTVLFGYDDPCIYEARPIGPDGEPGECDASRADLVMFLPFEQKP